MKKPATIEEVLAVNSALKKAVDNAKGEGITRISLKRIREKAREEQE